MRPAQKAPENAAAAKFYIDEKLASMRPAQKAPENLAAPLGVSFDVGQLQ